MSHFSENRGKDRSKEDRGKCELSLTVNGKPETVRVYPMERLWMSCARARVTARKKVAERVNAVLLHLDEWRVVNSCLIPALQAAGTKLTTIEGIAEGPRLSALQAAFWNAVARNAASALRHDSG